jgi:hypothetical protein
VPNACARHAGRIGLDLPTIKPAFPVSDTAQPACCTSRTMLFLQASEEIALFV